MTLDPSPEKPRRRLLVVGAVALAGLSLAALTGYVLLAQPTRLLASQGAPEPPVIVEGRVVDPAGKPLPQVSVHVGELIAQTDAEGRFSIGPIGPERTALVKLPGYERHRVALDGAPVAVTLKPQAVKAAYLTYYGIADKGIRERVFDLLDRTELNAVVIDVKGDRGLIPYRTQVPAALEAGALGPVIMKDFDKILADLKSKNVYLIARIVAFKENVLATARPDLAVIDTRTGKAWIDNERLAWVDPTREEVWDYLIAVAKEAAAKGFDEIQFDYVRFPTDGKLSAAKYSKPITPQVRIETIAAFLAKARKELGPTGVFLSADIFGYTAFNDNDTDIGQRIEDLGAPCRLSQSHGLSLGLSPGDPRLPEPGGPLLRDRPREHPAHAEAHRGPPPSRSAPGSRTSRTTPSTSASSACPRSATRSAGPTMAVATGGCSGIPATTTRRRRFVQAPRWRGSRPRPRSLDRPRRHEPDPVARRDGHRRGSRGRAARRAALPDRRAPAQRARAGDDPRVPQDRSPRGALDADARQLPA